MEKKEKWQQRRDWRCWGGLMTPGSQNLESKYMMEPFRRGKEPGDGNKRHHERGRRPFTRDFLCSTLVLTSIRAIIRPPPHPKLELLACRHCKRRRIRRFQYSDLRSAAAASASAKQHYSVRMQSQQDKKIKSKHGRIKVELRRKISDVESMILSGALDLYETSSVLY